MPTKRGAQVRPNASPAPAVTPARGLTNAKRYSTLRYSPTPAKYADERGDDEQHCREHQHHRGRERRPGQQPAAARVRVFGVHHSPGAVSPSV